MQEIRFRQAIFHPVTGKFLSWHYWGLIDKAFVGIDTGWVTPTEAINNSQMMMEEGIYGGDIVSRFGQDIHKKKIESRYTVCFGLYDNSEEYEDWAGGNGWYLGQELFFRAGKREAGGWESKCRDLIDTNGLEVIGNIYENPELLEGGK